jgi:hypothetical protein
MGLERSLLSLVSTTEELFGRNSSGCGLESREYGRRERSVTLTTWHPLPQTLTLTSPTSGSRSVGIVRSRTQVSEFFFFVRKTFRCNESFTRVNGRFSTQHKSLSFRIINDLILL